VGYLSDLLYEVAPRDPIAFVAAAAALTATGVLAARLPARRAARIDPTQALGSE
jgi:ABC-type lipoprotein release transport system permease subunit